MKKTNTLSEDFLLELKESVDWLKTQYSRRPLPIQLFLLLCINLILAPAVMAATKLEITRFQAYTLGILGLVTVGLSFYLFIVIFQPERF